MPSITPELYTIPLDADRYIVYAPLRRTAFVANAAAVNFIAALREDSTDIPADPEGSMLEFLRRLEIADAAQEEPPAAIFHGDPQPTSVTLFLTTACNLRCTYCYASAGDTPLKSMTMDVARRGIDFVAANAKRRGESYFEVAYHGGGEPTANWRVMTGSFDYARERGAALNLHVRGTSATNGVLRDDQINWIIDNLEGVSLSFDGLPEVHDRHRLTVLGGGSSQRVMHTLRRFDEAGYPYGMRVTVTADQIPLLPQSVEFICSHFAPERIQVEPSFNLGRWREAPSAETADFIAAFREAQRRASELGREIFYSAARLGVVTNHFCGLTQDLFALSPDGNVSACYEVFAEDNPWGETFFYGKPDAHTSGYHFQLPVLNNLRSQTVNHREFCGGCYAKWSCAGDCYHKSLNVNGAGEFAGSDRCHITRELTKDQILARINASGGVFWHAAPEEFAGRPGGKELML